MKGRMNTGLGEIVINPDVIALYAGSVAVECFGIVLGETNVGYSLMFTGIIILIRQMPVRNMSSSVYMCSFFSSHRYLCLIQFHNSDAGTSQLNMLIVVMTDTGN